MINLERKLPGNKCNKMIVKTLRTFLALSLLFLSTEKGNAQDFLNGDFEINTSGPCNYNLSNAVFTATMANVDAYGGAQELDIMGPVGACPYGNPQNGNWFVGLAFPTTTDAFTMTLCSPLVQGTTYTMEFWDKGDSQYPPGMPVVIGVSTAPGVSGTTVYTGPVPTADIWTLRNFTFVAPNNGLYISVETAGPTRWTHVDNFKILNNSSNTVTASPIAGSPYCPCSTVNVSFTSTGTFNAGNVYTALLSDATGSFGSATTIGTLSSTANAGSIVCTIPCNAVPGSSYLIQVTSSNPGVICSVGSTNITIGSGSAVSVNSPSICSGQTANLMASGSSSYTWSAGVTVTGTNTASVSPVTTTTYTVTGAGGGGSCADSAVATVTVSPAITMSVNSPTICAGQTANLTATGATTYVWSTGATSTGGGNANASPVTTTTYTVTGTSGGCSDSVICTVTVNPVPVINVNSPTICAGQTANLVATGATTYSWSAGATSTGGGNANATPASTTTYTVTGMTNGCNGTAIATVTVVASLPVTVNSPTICSGQTANLSATGATNYSWTTGATSTGGGNATASPLTTTTYTVTGTSGTCSGTAVSTVTVNTTPVVTVNSPTICSGQTANLTATGATTYTWTAGANATTGGNATATPLTTTTYTVTGMTNNCMGTAISTVTVNPTPVVSVNSPTICSGQTAYLSATGAAGYSWTAGATATGGGNATALPVVTTTYTVTGTTGSCTNTAVSTVTVNTTPVVTVTSDTICPGQTATLTASGAATYTWSAGATSSGGNTATASPLSTSTYTVTGTTAGCSNTAIATVIIQNCVPPIANFVGNPLVICNNGCTTFIDISINAPTSWSWQFPGGVPSSANTQGPINVCYSATGAYPVVLTVSNPQGTDTLTRLAYVNVVNPIPVSITGNLFINACDPADLTAMPAEQTYSWGPNVNITCSTCQTAIVTPLSTQQYYCQAIDTNGCYSADTATVYVTQEFTYFMPTGFSPNGDRVNDVLYVYGKGIEFIALKIYDRVGEKVFETADILKGWDGTLYGVPMNNGEFVYTLEVTYCNGQTVKEQGSVMLEK